MTEEPVMEVLPAAAAPPVTVVDLSKGAPGSTIALPHFANQACHAAMPAASCSGVELANIYATDTPLKAPSERYKTRYLLI